MKIMTALFLILMSFNTFAVWDMLVKANPNLAYMNFFYKGYIPWFENTFKTKLELPGDKDQTFIKDAINHLDHWKVKDHFFYDQLLIGENQKMQFSLRIYVHPDLRKHPYITSKKLPLSPDFISWDGNELCFLTFTETPGWRHLPKNGKDFISHFCQEKNTFVLKYVSHIAARETKKFKDPFPGLSEWEIATWDKTHQVSSFFDNKNIHMAFIPKEFYPFVLEHGSATHMPLDKYSFNEENQMTVYYP